MALLFRLLKRFRNKDAPAASVPSWLRLVAALIAYISYVLIGAAIVMAIEKDDEFDATGANANWNFGSSCYFLVISTTTIGYGDISPSTSSGRAFIGIYGLIGLGLVGYVITMAGGAVMDFMNWQRSMFTKHVLRSNSLKGKVNNTSDIPWIVAHSALITAFVTWTLFLFIGAAIFKETERDEWEGSIGAADVTSSNEWSYKNSLWFCWVTLTTIGYGDFYPTSNAGKVLLPIYAVFSLGVVGVVIGEIGEMVAKSAERALLGKSASASLTEDQADGVITAAKNAAKKDKMDPGVRDKLAAGLSDALRMLESSGNYRSADIESYTESEYSYTDDDYYTTEES